MTSKWLERLLLFPIEYDNIWILSPHQICNFVFSDMCLGMIVVKSKGSSNNGKRRRKNKTAWEDTCDLGYCLVLCACRAGWTEGLPGWRLNCSRTWQLLHAWGFEQSFKKCDNQGMIDLLDKCLPLLHELLACQLCTKIEIRRQLSSLMQDRCLPSRLL